MSVPSALLSQLASEAAPTVQLPRSSSPLAPPSGGVPPPHPVIHLAGAQPPVPMTDFHDVVASPPPPPPVHIPVGPPPIGPQKQLSTNDRNAPMRGMPPIALTTSKPDAQYLRMSWKGPSIFPGEPVFFRRARENDEHMAWVLGTSNQTYTLMLLPGNGTPGPKSSVAYHDPFGPAHENDPMAPHTNAGTFRRTEFGRVVSQLMALQQQQHQANPVTLEMLSSIRQESLNAIRSLQDQVESLRREQEAAKTALEIADELSAPVAGTPVPEQPKAVEVKASTEPKNGGKAKSN